MGMVKRGVALWCATGGFGPWRKVGLKHLGAQDEGLGLSETFEGAAERGRGGPDTGVWATLFIELAV